MARAEKYRIDFKTLDGHDARVQFLYEGYSGAITNLTGGSRPFVLREFNTDEDLFKPVRPQLAEIEILASASGITIDSFLADQDTDILVIFSYINVNQAYWYGYLLQDDFQETWQNTNHFIIVTASEGFGYLKNIQLNNSGNEISGTATPLTFLEYAMQNTVQSFAVHSIINNLYNDVMSDAVNTSPLDQCKINAKTFQTQDQFYNDAYTVIEKINRAFNQTIFMYKGYWWIIRLEDLFIPFNDNLRGYTSNVGTRSSINTRYDIEVGVNNEVKPISPEMIRFIRRRTKKDTIQFDYNQFNEIVCNQSFSRGAIVTNTSSLKTYNVTQWNYYAGTVINSPTTPTSGALLRNETFDANGNLEDNYVSIPQDSSEYRYMKSCAIPVLANEKFTMSIDHRYKLDPPGGAYNDVWGAILLVGDTNNYTVDERGEWFVSNASFTLNFKQFSNYYDGTDVPKSTDWMTNTIETDVIPENGNIYLIFWMTSFNYTAGQQKWFKDLRFDLFTRFAGMNTRGITGVQSIYTKSDDLKNNFEDIIYVSDGVSRVYKGSLFQTDGLTLLDPDWYRYRYNSESFSFRRQNATAHWQHNRFNRNKIDANFFGLAFNTNQPIGLLNTIKFVDDDPNRVYAILNLKEIDFASGTWSATLEEIYNAGEDAGTGVTEYFEAEVIPGTYSSTNYVPLAITEPADVTISGSYVLTYTGVDTVTVTVEATVGGYVNYVNSTPTTVYIYLRKNGANIGTYPITVNNLPEGFNAYFNVAGVSLSTNDTLDLYIDSNILEIQLSLGYLNFNYPVTTPLTYDTYQDKYLYQ